MLRSKYPISKEYFPLDRIHFPVSRSFLALSRKIMRTPNFFLHDPDVITEKRVISSYDGGEIELYILTPKDIASNAPCLVFIHGGGFVYEGAGSHFRVLLRYTKELGCKSVYIRYRLAPVCPFPAAHEDCYEGLKWVFENAEALGIDTHRVAITGDSAGGTLTVTSTMMLRDRLPQYRVLFHLLVYPWLDNRNNSPSNLRFTDTPMWNSTLSKKVGPLVDPRPEIPSPYRSPVQGDLSGMPPAYVEVAEFDALRDDGITYVRLLNERGIPAELHEAKATMHGYDGILRASTTQKMIALRIGYMKKMFGL